MTFALAALAAGCGMTAGDDASGIADRGGSDGTAPPSAGSGDDAALATDGGAPQKGGYRGSPLCGVTEPTECFPDDEVGTTASEQTGACSVEYATEADGGASGGEVDGATPSIAKADGCRLRVADAGATGPSCQPASLRGTDGMACQGGSDCAPGFDCVPGEKGSVCRHYCCSGTCDGRMSQNGGPTFCDIRTLIDTQAQAPVCVPLKRCKLMSAGACNDDETCAIVTEMGDTGCVAVGSAAEGSSCEETHCGAGLTCLGQVGSRKCYELCSLAVPGACGPDQTCKTSTLFKDSQFGVCSGG